MYFRYLRPLSDPGFRRYYSSVKLPWKVLFLGNDEFSLPHLKELHRFKERNGHNIVESIDVTASQDKRCIVRDYAVQNSLKIHEWPLDLNVKYDIGILVSYGRLIPGNVIEHFPHGIINVHPSLLPKYRGGAPLIHTLLAGDTITGISVTKVAPHRFDVGSLLYQETIAIEPETDFVKFTEFMALMGSQAIIHVLKSMSEGKIIETPQSNIGASQAPKVKPEYSNIDWHRSTCSQIQRQYRALGHLNGLKSSWNGKRIRLKEIVPGSKMKDINEDFYRQLQCADTKNIEPGQPLFSKKYRALGIRCKEGWVAFRTISVEMKEIAASNFYDDHLTKSDKSFRSRAMKDLTLFPKFESIDNGLDKFKHWRGNSES